MNHITIRQATLSDIPKVVDLWAEHVDFHAAYDAHFTRKQNSEEVFSNYLREQIDNPGLLLLVAESGAKIVGFLLAELGKYPPCFVQRDYVAISDIAVTKDFRRRGIGRQLLAEAMKWFASKGIDRIETRVATTNPLSTQFWRQMGFSPYIEIMYLEQHSNPRT
jgi:ribosomal protein S18 acetylase RimI-like enzyme